MQQTDKSDFIIWHVCIWHSSQHNKLYVSACLLQVKRASLVDSRTAVNDVKFSPRHLGLQLVRS